MVGMNADQCFYLRMFDTSQKIPRRNDYEFLGNLGTRLNRVSCRLIPLLGRTEEISLHCQA